VAARRAGRLGDGFFPGRGTVEELTELITVAHRAAEEAGRDPDALEITATADRTFFADAAAAVRRYEELGISRILMPPLTFNPTKIGEALARFREDVLAPLG